MKKLVQNEDGFSVFEGILLFVIIILIGAVGYLVYKNHDKSTQDSSAVKTSATTKAPAATAKTIQSYADCTEDKTAKTDTGTYPPTCTTSQNVTFRPTDPSNFPQVGSKIDIPNNPKVTSDANMAQSSDGYCYTNEVPGLQATATLTKQVYTYALVKVAPNCGDSIELTYSKTSSNWSVINTSHLGLCFNANSNTTLQDAISKLCQ